MGNWDHIISDWMYIQNNEFLQKVKASYIFNINNKLHNTSSPFAKFSEDGKQIFINHNVFVFDRTFSPNRAVYKILHSQNDTLYISIIFHQYSIFLYTADCILHYDKNSCMQISLVPINNLNVIP